MSTFNSEMRVILVGGSSHAGKSTLARSLATTLGWSYRSTDQLARHPGRPWVGAYGRAVPDHVAEHYRNFPVDALLSDVLSHYKKNVMPQVETIVRSHAADPSMECLVLEGSALWPEFVTDLVGENGIKAIWLTAGEPLFRKRILNESNFDNASAPEKHLIQKFLERTLLYDKRMREEVERFGLMCTDIESVSTVGELSEKCIGLIADSGPGENQKEADTL
ncbi:MAG: 2-phosphoglycerate kinase [Fibrella sp.]|nr:2-phosphoglycerate kinase [Armatimonadota bacterium]